MRSSATSAAKSIETEKRLIDLLIDYQCPQCGAPATLQETDRLFTCAFCRVKSYLLPSPYFRYRLPERAPQGKALIYFPYWRFKGMTFTCLAGGIRHRFDDVSVQAAPSRWFPATVGLRSQALKLKFALPENGDRFIPPTRPFAEALAAIDARFSATLPSPVLHQAHIGETQSLLYAPFYVERRMIDALLNRPVSPDLPADFDVEGLKPAPPGGSIHFIGTLCPACGWDLEGSRDALALHCNNCRTIWMPRNRKLAMLSTAHVGADGGDLAYLPFWRIAADVAGIQLASYADLVRAANLPKVIFDSMQDLPFHFWGPAFKIRPQSYLRVATAVTLAQPGADLAPGLPGTRMLPVNLPLTEAVQTAKLTVANFVKPRQFLNAVLPQIAVKARRATLVYLPFAVRHHEYVHTGMRLAINKNQLALATNL